MTGQFPYYAIMTNLFFMKRTFHILSLLLLCPYALVFAGEFADSGAAFSVDFPSGWVAGKSDDPAMVLKLEKGKSFFEFSKLDSELSDYYLRARVKEQVDSLRSKGNIIGGETRQIGIRGGAAAYYTSYESMGTKVYTAFFTHNGLSYAVSARGLGGEEFRGVLSTVRRPGEKIETPKPKKIKVYRKPKPENAEELTQVFKEEEPVVSTEAVAVFTPPPVAAAPEETIDNPAGARVMRAAWDFLAAIDDIGQSDSRTPYLRRRPLDFRVWGALLIAWLLGASLAKIWSGKFQNPKLSPPPKEVPPDFFFPFIVSRDSTLKGCSYNVLTRQNQRLLASFNSEHDFYLVVAVYAGLLFHVCWSFLAYAGWGGVVTGFMLALPGGRLWASMPEIFFAAPLIAGISIYCNQTQALRLLDSSLNLMMEVKNEAAGCLIRDEKGKEIARVVKTGGLAARAWHFMDTDNTVVLTIKDDYPAAHVLRIFFGNLGGALRSRYGIFAAERRAGFVFLDPSSVDRFQIHLDFDFARMAHPAQILAIVLYIISTEKDPAYPWI